MNKEKYGSGGSRGSKCRHHGQCTGTKIKVSCSPLPFPAVDAAGEALRAGYGGTQSQHQEAEAMDLCEFQASLGYTVRPCLKRKALMLVDRKEPR